MYSFMLNNWTTIRGATTVGSITQSQSAWLDLSGFQDIVAWLDVREANAGGGTAVTLTYQTSPTADEILFAPLTTAVTLTSGSVTVTKMLASAATVPIGRWLRWQLAVTGVPTLAWDATFRVWIAANVGVGRRGAAAAARAMLTDRAPAMSVPSSSGTCSGCGPSRAPTTRVAARFRGGS